MTLRRIVGYLLLSLALLSTQQALAAHALTHPVGSVPSKQDPGSPSHGNTCALCVAATHAGSVLVSASPQVQTDAATLHAIVCGVWSYRPALTLAFSSRAPPTLL